MTQFDFKFISRDSITSSSKNPASDRIKTLIEASKSANQHLTIENATQKIRDRESEIQSMLTVLGDSSVNFINAEFDNPVIEPDQTIRGKEDVYKWKMNYKLTSEIYTCINIWSDKTIVCYKRGEGRVLFIKLGTKDMIIQ